MSDRDHLRQAITEPDEPMEGHPMSPFLLLLAGFGLFTLGLLLGAMLRGADPS